MTATNFSEGLEQLAAFLRKLHAHRPGTSGEPTPDMSPDELEECLEQLHIASEELQSQQETVADRQQAIADERQRYQELFDALIDASLVSDGNGVIRDANVAAVQLFRVPERSALVGKPLAVMMTAEDVRPLRAALGEISNSGRRLFRELRFQPRKDEPAFLAAVTGAVMSWHAPGRPDQIRWMIRDLTDQKLLEEHLRTAETQVKLSARLAAIGMMATGVVHEIAEAFGTIQLAAQMASRGRDKHPELKEVFEALDVITDAARRSGQIAHNIVRYAKDRPTKKWSNDLNGLVTKAIQRTPECGAQRDVPVRINLTSEPILILCDPLEIELVLSHLLCNALESGGPEVEVEVTTSRNEEKGQIEVRDTGAGMTHQQRRRAFDPFYTTRNTRGALGLGLSITQAIVLAHEGLVELHSELGRGTRVMLQLPLADIAGE